MADSLDSLHRRSSLVIGRALLKFILLFAFSLYLVAGSLVALTTFAARIGGLDGVRERIGFATKAVFPVTDQSLWREALGLAMALALTVVVVHVTRRAARELRRFWRVIDQPGSALFVAPDSAAAHREDGDRCLAAKDFAGAAAAYRRVLYDSRTLLASFHEDDTGYVEQALGYVVESLQRVGDVLMASADREGALAAYGESLVLTRRRVEMLASLPEGEFGYVARQLGPVVESLQRVGDVLMASADCEGALAAYRESIPLARRLVELAPQDEKAASALAGAETKLRDIEK